MDWSTDGNNGAGEIPADLPVLPATVPGLPEAVQRAWEEYHNVQAQALDATNQPVLHQPQPPFTLQHPLDWRHLELPDGFPNDWPGLMPSPESDTLPPGYVFHPSPRTPGTFVIRADPNNEPSTAAAAVTAVDATNATNATNSNDTATDTTTTDTTNATNVPDTSNNEPPATPPLQEPRGTALDAICEAFDMSIQPFDDPPVPASIPWPPNRLPIEIFELIISYLSRTDIRNLRLVSQEFEAKITAQYFRNIVVPFKSELYRILSSDSESVLRSSSHVISTGMRIFQSFGEHIRRFALSLELDERALAYPPMKPSQEAIPTFWGMYRWPHMNYHRFAYIEGLERTADETQAMKQAFKHLTHVQDLGLCCDAGLGYLNGPDVPQGSPTVRRLPFMTADASEHEEAAQDEASRATPKQPKKKKKEEKQEKGPSYENPLSFKRSLINKMVADANYSGSDIEEAVRLVLESEGTSLARIDIDERMFERDGAFGELVSARPLPDKKDEYDKFPLTPNYLTRSQKEMLLELEWAQRAMIQSFTIAVIDNANAGAFSNLTTLTIAKISSSHLHILHRHELWQALSTLNHLHLGVVADWRRISKSSPGAIDDTPISPTLACDPVFTLLDLYISCAINIERLSFEWICGGEFAGGSFQRNHHVLPAPVFIDPTVIVGPNSLFNDDNNLLRLPFIKHLSLKNCWVTPHVFIEFIRHMALASLQKLELESVSLSGPPTIILQNPLLNQQIATPPGQWTPALLEALNGQAGVNWPPPPNPNAQALQTMPLEKPERFSWAGFIEQFSPSLKIRDRIQQEPGGSSNAPMFDRELFARFVPKSQALLREESEYALKTLSFKSCGYVTIDSPFINSRRLLPRGASGLRGNNSPHREDLTPVMQRQRDGLLGRIVPCISEKEANQLVNGFGMHMGWENVYSRNDYLASLADGVDYPGRGRFTGEVRSLDED